MAVTTEAEASPRIQEARKLSKTDASKAEAIYKDILSKKPGGTAAALLEYEAALLGLGESYRDTSKWNNLSELVKSSTSQLTSFTKAKTAKLGMVPIFFTTQPVTLKADMAIQSANSSTSSPPPPQLYLSRFPPQNHASNGPFPNAAPSCANLSKPA